MPYLEEDYLEDEEEMMNIDEEEWDDETLEMLESEGEDWEEWDDEELPESLAERRWRRWPRYRRRPRRRYYWRPRPYRPVRGARGAVIRTPAGTARVRFPRPVATKESVDARLKELKKEISRNTVGIKKLDRTLDKNTSILDKKINTVKADLKKGMQQMQQMMLLPMLLAKPPELKSITIQKDGDDGTPTKYSVIAQKYKKSDTLTLLLPLLMMSGGFGAGADSSNMMVMALLLAQVI